MKQDQLKDIRNRSREKAPTEPHFVREAFFALAHFDRSLLVGALQSSLRQIKRKTDLIAEWREEAEQCYITIDELNRQVRRLQKREMRLLSKIGNYERYKNYGPQQPEAGEEPGDLQDADGEKETVEGDC